MRPVFDPTGGPDVLVEKMIGTAYETVKRVYCHLPEIRRLDDVLAEIPTLAQTTVDNALAGALPPILDQLDEKVQVAEGWAGEAEASAEAAAQSALAATKVNMMFPFTSDVSQMIYDVTVISGQTDVNTAGMALWVEGAIEFDFTILSATTFMLNDATSYPDNVQMRVILNAHFNDLVHGFDQLLGALEQEYKDAAALNGRWCGLHLVPPTTRLDSSPLQEADEYQNRSDKLRYSWNGSTWVALNSSAQQLEARLKNNSDPTKGVAETGFAGSTSAIEFYRGRSLQVPSKISLSAHRGLSRVAPENTIAAFEMAARGGFHGLETDAQLTSDGVWVVIHDSQVNRTTNGTGNVKDMTLAQLRALDAGSWFDPYYSSEKIPTLDEYLRVCQLYGCTPHIELKDIERSYTDSEISSLAEACKVVFPELDFVLYCFSTTLISRLRSLHRDITLAYLTETFSAAAIDLCADLHPCGLSINRSAVPADISYATGKGVYLSAWTIDYSLFAEPLFKKGVRKLITNGWKP